MEKVIDDIALTINDIKQMIIDHKRMVSLVLKHEKISDSMEVDLKLKEDVEKMLANQANQRGDEPWVISILKRITPYFCWSCGAKYDTRDVYCSQCGNRILAYKLKDKICWECKAEMNEWDTYCRQCGGKLEECRLLAGKESLMSDLPKSNP